MATLSVVAGCGDADDASTAGSTTTVGSVTTSSAPSTPTTVGHESTTTVEATTSSTTATTVPTDPCAPRGYVEGPAGDPVEVDPEDPWSVAVDNRQLSGPPGRVYETDSLVLGGGFYDPRTFDWDEDGAADSVTMGVGSVSVHAASGTTTVTGVRTDFSDVGHYSSIHSAMPLDVGDVTGDGHVDLMVASDGWVGVLAGAGSSAVPVTVAFDRIGVDAVGWLTPPAIERHSPDVPPGREVYETWPHGTAEPVLLDDVDGDGIAEIGVYNHLERTSGPFMLLLGQPCNP
jgi:hypothetical protein